jgi:hypothetical protein
MRSLVPTVRNPRAVEGDAGLILHQDAGLECPDAGGLGGYDEGI